MQSRSARRAVRVVVDPRPGSPAHTAPRPVEHGVADETGVLRQRGDRVQPDVPALRDAAAGAGRTGQTERTWDGPSFQGMVRSLAATKRARSEEHTSEL